MILLAACITLGVVWLFTGNRNNSPFVLKTPATYVNSIAFSYDGRHLFAAYWSCGLWLGGWEVTPSRLKRTTILWDFRNGQRITEDYIPYLDGLNHFAHYLTTGTLIGMPWHDIIVLYNNGHLLRKELLPGFTASTLPESAPAAGRFVQGANDDTLRMTTASAAGIGSWITSPVYPGLSAVALSQDGASIAVATKPGTVQLVTWDHSHQIERWVLPEDVWNITILSDNNTCICSTERGRLYLLPPGTTTPKLLRPIKNRTFAHLASHPSHMEVAVTYELKKGRGKYGVSIWRPPFIHELATSSTERLPTCARYSPDGRFLAVGDEGGNISIWDLVHVKAASQRE